jgi:hypothetical protein
MDPLLKRVVHNWLRETRYSAMKALGLVPASSAAVALASGSAAQRR